MRYPSHAFTGLVLVLLLHGPANAQQVISYGETVTGMIDPVGEVDTYTFSGSAGDPVLIRMTRISGTNFQPQLQLFDPSGNSIKSTAGTLVAEIRLSLPATGSYTLLASESSAGPSVTGNYGLFLQRTRDPGNAISISYGETVTGAINPVGEADTYTFSGSAGDPVLIRMTRISGTNFQPRIELSDPDGNTIESAAGTLVAGLRTILPATGVYTIISNEGNENPNVTGNYALFLQRTRDPGNATHISYGETVTGAINPVGETDTYTFSGCVDDAVLLRMTRISGINFQPRVELFDPDGNTIGSAADVSVAQLGATLSGTGTYTIMTNESNANPNVTGNYSLFLQRTSSQPNHLSVEPAAQDFGAVKVGDTKMLSVTVTNTSTDDLEITSIALSGPGAGRFAVDTTPFSLGAGESVDLEVSFTPEAIGIVTASLDLVTPCGSPGASLTGEGAAPDITVAPLSYSYGSIEIGTTAQHPFTVSNTGTADLSVSAITLAGSDAGEFSIVSGSAPFMLAPNATRDIVVRFNPTSEGAKDAELLLTSDDPDESPFGVALSGTGTTLAMPNIAVSPVTYSFGEVDVGASSIHTFVVSNTGDAVLEVTNVQVQEANPLSFSIDSGGEAFMLAAGDMHNIVIRFSPTAAGVKNAVLRLTSNDVDETPFDIPLEGTGIEPVMEPAITVTPPVHDFGSVQVGTTTQQVFTVTNTGTVDLTVSATTLQGNDASQFTLSGGGSFTLTPSATRNLTVSFTPTSEGSKNATLRITSNDPDDNPLNVSLTGTAVGNPVPALAVTPTAYDFGSVELGTTAQHTFMASNTGSADLSVSAITLIGSEAAEFSTDSGNLPLTLAPNTTHDIIVSFIPTSEGSKNATLRITSNALDASTFDVDLSGMGVTVPTPRLLVEPEALAFGETIVGQSSTRSLQVQNAGTASLEVSQVTISGSDPSLFDVDNMSFTVAPGAHRELLVHFSPDQEGTKNAQLVISSNGGTVTVPLSGTAIAAVPVLTVTPEAQDFGEVLVGDSASDALVVSNTGTADLDVTTIVLQGPHSDQFSIDQTLFSLAPGTAHNITTSFTPLSSGDYSATLLIESNANSATVELRGSSPSTVDADRSEVPLEFVVHSPYPNPFNPTTTVTYDLPVAAEVQIRVFSPLGHLIEEVSLGRIHRGRNHSFQIDAGKLASGVYFYWVIAQTENGVERQGGSITLLK